MTYAQKFKAKAKDLMPHHEDLQNVSDEIDDAGQVDDIMFAWSEYIGGMAAVIRELIEREK